MKDEIRDRYQQVLEQMERATQSAGRASGAARLIVVSKTHPLETIRTAIEAGVRDLGESYAEEALAKIDAAGPVSGLRWHMIGHIQSRKANLIAANFQMAHAVDSLKLAARLDRFATTPLPILLEVNVSGEASKYGYAAWDESQWDALRPEFEQIIALPNLSVSGLMTMPPYADHPEASRPFFKKMRALQAFLVKNLPLGNWGELSMGTSLDFPVAVEEGATLVRVGSAILGTRKAKG